MTDVVFDTASWKARGRLLIRHNWTFSLSLTVEAL